MTPTIAIAAPPARPPLLRPSEVAGLRIAIMRCGPPIEAGTVEQVIAAVYDAERELERIENIAARYSRRYQLPCAAAPSRLQVRHCVVRQIAEQRSEFSRLLIREPVAGCA